MRIKELILSSRQPFFSLEFFPPSDPAEIQDFYATVEDLRVLNPLFVSVTYGAGGAKQGKSLAVTAELAQRGLNVLAHLTCIGAEREHIANFLHELNAVGVNNVLALRGDPPKDKGPDWRNGFYRHASDLVRFVRNTMPDMGIGVAAYPSPHPESRSFAEDRVYTAQKLAAGADFAITQLFFDVREYESLVDNLRARGVSVPVIPGILPIQSFQTLKRVLSLCGANIPGKLYLELEEAHTRGGADAVREAGLAFALRQIRELLDYGAPGIHLYTLNKSGLCRRIAEEIRI